MNEQDCGCQHFFLADIHVEGKRLRLQPKSLDGLVQHFGDDKKMAMGFLLEVARTLGQLGFVASREGVLQEELKVEDPMKILTGAQTLPWSRETTTTAAAGRPGGVITAMYCCEGHGKPYYCTAPG